MCIARPHVCGTSRRSSTGRHPNAVNGHGQRLSPLLRRTCLVFSLDAVLSVSRDANREAILKPTGPIIARGEVADRFQHNK
jgi:hypothetical protein